MKIARQAGGLLALLTIVVGSFALGSCAEEDTTYLRLPKDADPQQEVQALARELKSDKESRVDVFAPDSFSKATHAFAEAQQKLETHSPNDDVLDRVARSRSYLGQAEERARQVQNELGLVIQARDRALAAGAAEQISAREEFDEADAQVSRFALDSDTPHGVIPLPDTERASLTAQYRLAEQRAQGK